MAIKQPPPDSNRDAALMLLAGAASLLVFGYVLGVLASLVR